MSKHFCLILCAIGCLHAAPEPPKLRLPDTVRPVRYAADLTLRTESATFSGKISIEVELQKASNIIWLNATELNIRNAVILVGAVTHKATVVPGGTDFIGLSVPTAIPAGRAKLLIEYDGKVSNKSSSGIFQSRDADNLYLFTQFESIDARRAYPCFDEPSFKTPWQITMHVHASDVALSNTPQVSETNETGGMKKVVFAPTKPLPSYLIAFAAGPFELVNAGVAGVNRVPVRIITPKGKRDQAKYAVEVTATIVQKLEDYFGIPYPYEKLDCIAIPLTFGFGAMENAGLETYVQSLVLNDPKTDTEERQHRYAAVAAHELAHQWFGDLVTTAWWDDIWLNEAFATWMSSKVIAGWHPEWASRVTDLKSKFDVMKMDGLASTRNIHQAIESNDDIGNAFDSITYQKGAAVIRMIEHWDGEKQFQTGVQNYLKRYAFKNARSADFLDSISAAGKPELTSAFSTFLNQPGVPEISVSLLCDHTPTLRLSQKYYRPLGAAASKAETWKVPVCVRYEAGKVAAQECFLLDQPEAAFKLTKASGCPSWISANDSASGYYTVNYSDDVRDKVLKNVNLLNAAERATLLNDLDALTLSGDLAEEKALAAVPVFAAAPEHQIVEKAEEVVFGARLLIGPDLRANYGRFVRKAFGERATRLGWTPQGPAGSEDNLIRARLLPFVAQQGDDAKLSGEATKLAEGWLRDRRGIDPNLLDAVLKTAAYSGGRELFDAFLRELKKSTDLGERRSIITALGSFQDRTLATQAMQLMLDPSIDMRETQMLLLHPGDHPPSEFAFVTRNYKALIERAPTGGSFQFGARLASVGEGLCDEKSRKEYENFFGPRVKDFTGGKRVFDQGLESIRNCEAQKEARGASAASFFAKQ